MKLLQVTSGLMKRLVSPSVIHCVSILTHFEANLFHNIHRIQKAISSLFPCTQLFATSKISGIKITFQELSTSSFQTIQISFLGFIETYILQELHFSTKPYGNQNWWNQFSFWKRVIPRWNSIFGFSVVRFVISTVSISIFSSSIAFSSLLRRLL